MICCVDDARNASYGTQKSPPRVMATEARNRVLDTLMSSNPATMSREQRIQALLASAAAALPHADAGRSIGELHPPAPAAAQPHHHHRSDDHGHSGSDDDHHWRSGRHSDSVPVATVSTSPAALALASPPRPTRLSNTLTPGTAPARVSASSATELLASGGNLSDRVRFFHLDHSPASR